ncbi:MAG TPA: 3-phosphoshikimate 1-carboxyvinyltransferase, partial [Bacteroidales bacterium]|nr:3-phosphoshikimate 1-carboxyvinyltransferase [Bacteroidales bacterium]
MKRLVKPSEVNGCVKAPASKSLAQRAIAIASMASGKSQILYAGNSDDVISAIEVCKALGADIKEVNDKLIISGGIKAPEQPLNCGESGLGIRMFSCIAATLKQPVTLTGKGTLAKRPMGILEQSIRAMGAHCKTQNGFIPITVKGPIAGGIAR